MFLRLVFLLLFGAISRLHAQEAFSDNLPTRADAKPGESTPESAWLDLRQNTPRHSTPQNAPPWVEAVTLFPAKGTGDTTPKTIRRIRPFRIRSALALSLQPLRPRQSRSAQIFSKARRFNSGSRRSRWRLC